MSGAQLEQLEQALERVPPRTAPHAPTLEQNCFGSSFPKSLLLPLLPIGGFLLKSQPDLRARIAVTPFSTVFGASPEFIQ